MSEAQRLIDAHLTEKQFMQMILDLARVTGWLCYHTHNSMHSASGYPDITLVHSRKRLGVHLWEVKVGKNKVTQAQAMWIDSLVASGCNARVVRPEDWQYIIETLQAA